MYEIEFFVGSIEYDMNVEVLTGKVTDFSVDYHHAYNPPVNNTQPGNNTQTTVTTYGYYCDDDPYDLDVYDHDFFDPYDFYDYDYDDMYDFD